MCALPDVEAMAENAARCTIARIAPFYDTDLTKTEIGIVFIDDDFMRDLNKQYRGKDRPTNVLSFPLARPAAPDVPILLGDVVLALQTIVREAAEAEKSLTAHMQHLIVHGVLHLLGYDHEAESDAKLMELLEIEILDAMGITNPYTVPVKAI